MSSKQAQMMYHNAQATYSKAAKAELQNDLDRAFRLYVKAAEDFLHLSQTSRDGRLRTEYKDEAGKALERAEKIKSVRPDLTPVATDHFSESIYQTTLITVSISHQLPIIVDEQAYVLRKSSYVNNIRISRWNEDRSRSEFERHPHLSLDQQQNSAVWRKVDDIPVFSPSSPLFPQDVVQHIITDCSVCASIASCVQHHRRFQSEIGLSNLRPDVPDNVPYHSQNGIYHVQIFFNGAYRRITIDDQLPSYPDGTLMCLSTGQKRQLWPSLMEKAYMKLMGGYDFPGSNSCIDLQQVSHCRDDGS